MELKKLDYSMETHLLKTFLVLAKTRNFTETADKLYRSQSAISLQIAKLETLLGKPLFIRDNRNVTLTLEGEQLVGCAQQILSLENKMISYFQPLCALSGEIRLGTPEDLATVYLPSILAKFIETNPNVLLNVRCEFTMDLLKGFDEKQYDLILIKQDPLSPDPRSQEVWKEPLVWVCPKEATASHIKTDETIPLVLAPQPCVYRQRAIDALNQQGISWRIVYTSPSVTGTIAAVKAGLGISVLPRKMLTEELRILKELPILKSAQIALLQQERPSETVLALANYIKSHIGPYSSSH